MDIVQVATILSDTVFTPSTKRRITVTPDRIDVKGTLDGTDKKGRVVVTTSGGMIGMGVWAWKTQDGLSARKSAEEINAAEVKNFGAVTLGGIRETLATA